MILCGNELGTWLYDFERDVELRAGSILLITKSEGVSTAKNTVSLLKLLTDGSIAWRILANMMISTIRHVQFLVLVSSFFFLLFANTVSLCFQVRYPDGINNWPCIISGGGRVRVSVFFRQTTGYYYLIDTWCWLLSLGENAEKSDDVYSCSTYMQCTTTVPL